jgi:hypothetical protein
VGESRLHQPLADAASSVRFVHDDVANPRERRPIRHRPKETDLKFTDERRQTERSPHARLDGPPVPVGRPVRGPQHRAYFVEIDELRLVRNP